jgi:hypothetical protein
VAGSTLVQLRVPDDVLARIDQASEGSTRTAWLLGLAQRQLDGGQPAQAPLSGARSLGPGIPAPGVLCLWAACMSRDSDRYGVADRRELERRDYGELPRNEDAVGLALCKHHAAILERRTYRAPRRELPPAWRRKQAEKPA